ncbi:hypothetical protein C8F01DRAFT_691639 [Mycena amicta]|nr:hypothetical protein C8F01DRAFT_691639 [Mycena amicta]
MPTPNAALRSTISDIEQRITSLEAELAALRAQKEQREQELQLSAVPYSEHPLPPNLLVKVLVLAANSGGLPEGTIAYNLALAGVCRQWREGVLATNELWTSISVNCARKTSLDILSTCLPRSGSLPINIYLRNIQSAGLAVWDVLLPYSARWRKLELYASSDSIVLSLANAAPHLPFFESLSIRGDVALEDGEHISAPNLRKLKLTTPFVVYQLALPLKQITSLDLTGESGAGILDMLALMPDLTSLVLSVQDTEPDVPDSEDSEAETAPSSPCVLTQLASLQYNDDLPPYILAGLYTPLLAHLTFPSLPPFDDMQSLIARSNSSIRSLKVHSLSTDAAAWLVWVKGLPDLEVLDMRVDAWQKSDFNQFHDLVTSSRGDGTLSELEQITLHGCPRDLNAALLAGLAAKRWHWVEGLTRVHTLRLSFLPRMKDAMEGVREQLQGEESKYVGLKVKLWDSESHKDNSDEED